MSRLYTGVVVAAGVAMLSQAAWAQEIGMVTIEPNPTTGEMRADIPARPDNETVYVMRDGQRIATAVVKSSGQAGGAVLQMSPAEATNVKKGDRISLTPDLKKEEQLPESAYQPVDPTASKPTAAAPPSLRGIVEESAGAGAPRLTGTPAPSVVDSSAKNGGSDTGGAKGDLPEKVGAPAVRSSRSARAAASAPPVEPISPRLTPRGSEIPLYPAPAIVPEAGVTAPYGVGLAAAAPVGTPFLRSPAFAGPPVIYMPQTVSRVLLPSVTPYPANIMQPPVRYPYASAPFTRTDIYVNLPYGTYYWPNGYAGTTPVEPQIPVYVTAPAAAVLTSEASYTTQRYAPGAAMAETLNPITVPPMVAGASSVEASLVPPVPVGEVATTLPAPVAPAMAPAVPNTFPSASPGGVAPAPAALPPLEPLSPFPSAGGSALPPPPLPPSSDPAMLPPIPPTNTTLPAPIAPSAPTTSTAPPPLPPLPGTNGTAPAGGPNPFAPDAAGAAGLPALPPLPGTTNP